MAIDPSIPLGVRSQPFNNPFAALMAMQEENQQRQAQQREDAQRATQQRQAQQRIDMDQARIDSADRKEFSAKQIHDAAESAYQKIKDGNADEVLGLLPPESRQLAEGWLTATMHAKQARDAAGIAEGKRTAQFIQANNYDPVTSATALKVLADVHPGAKDALEHVTNPAAFKKLIDHFATLGDKPEADFTLGEGQTRFDPTGKQIASVAKPADEPKSIDAAIAAARNNPMELNRLIKIKKMEADATRAPNAGGADRAPFWVNRGGKMIRITEAEYRPGDLPASTREQGRSVTAGDAEDLANFDTSADELSAVRAAIGPSDSTGIVAQIGAKIPYVTQITGWGTDAKKRQAVIDRVKQVIGKTLEGGVLRKEDEAKYEKILPTIGDPNDVAIAKLDGLESALVKRKARRLDALKDANYDVTKFEARSPAKPSGGTVRMRAPNGQETDVSLDQVEHYKSRGATVVR